MDVPWIPLNLLSTGVNVRLFAKSHFTPSSYTVLLTDLCHIWEESLERKQILRRALELDTSIDPMEGSDQLQLLLEKIKNAVHGLEGTSVQLAHPDPGLSFRLFLVTSLPAPFEDLKWEMHFEPSPDISVKEHLTLPLITMAHQQHSQIDDLIGHLIAKDHVITKLLDKLEGSGFDLSTIYPGIAGTRKQSTTRHQVARQVHGVGTFDLEKWQSTRKHTLLTDYTHILSEIGTMSATEKGEKNIKDHWLARLPASFGATTGEVPETRTIRETNGTTASSVRATSGTQDEDAFERQATPPHFRKARPDAVWTSAQPSAVSSISTGDSVEDETTDDDDLDAPPRKMLQSGQDTESSLVASQPKSTTSPSSPTKPGKLGGVITTPTLSLALTSHSKSEERSTLARSKKLGKLGGPTRPSTELARQRNQSNPKQHIPDSGRETESEADLDEPNQLNTTKHEDTVAKEPANPAKSLLKRGTIGKLGGGKKSAAGRENLPLSPDVVSTNTPEVDGARGAKPGTGKDSMQISPNSEGAKSASNPSKGSSPGRKQLTPPTDVPQESEEQRANRKREELKRALESMSQPAKKRRKF